jgi:hypothetical protein
MTRCIFVRLLVTGGSFLYVRLMFVELNVLSHIFGADLPRKYIYLEEGREMRVILF